MYFFSSFFRRYAKVVSLVSVYFYPPLLLSLSFLSLYSPRSPSITLSSSSLSPFSPLIITLSLCPLFLFPLPPSFSLSLSFPPLLHTLRQCGHYIIQLTLAGWSPSRSSSSCSRWVAKGFQTRLFYRRTNNAWPLLALTE